jgi:ABC-2 type transport system permease protein
VINANIYRHELRRNRVSFFVWGICISAFILIGMLSYPILMHGDTFTQVRALFENPFMKNIISFFGSSLDALTNILGFYTFRNAVFVMLLGSFFSILLGGKILAQEEHEKTAEFLLSKPVTRSEVVWSKLAAFFTYLLLLNVIVLLVGFASLEVFKGDSDYRLTAFLVHTFYAFLLMLTFGAAGLFLSLWIKRGRPITSLSIGIIMGGYFFDVFSRITKSLDKIGYVSPFKFVDSGVLRPDYGLVWWRVLYFLGISLVLFTLSFFIYRKKDILV